MSIRTILAAALAVALAGTAAAAPWSVVPVPDAKSPNPVERGRAVFLGRCEVCHGTGPDRAGTLSLGFKYGSKKPALLEERRDLTPKLIKYYARHGSGMMPFFRKTELSDQELDDVAAYLSRKRR